MRVEFDHAGTHWSAFVTYDPGAPAYRLDDPDLAEEAVPDEVEIDELWHLPAGGEWHCVDWVLGTDWIEELLDAALRAARREHARGPDND